MYCIYTVIEVCTGAVGERRNRGCCERNNQNKMLVQNKDLFIWNGELEALVGSRVPMPKRKRSKLFKRNTRFQCTAGTSSA